MNNQAAQTMPEPVTASMCPSSDYAKGWNDCRATMLAAAPAASGVHPDALPDGTLSKSTAKRVEALASASVSERARTASLKEIVPAEKRNYLDDNGNPRSIEDEAYAHGWNACRAATIRALEQALTQKRGECWPLNKNPKDGWTFDPSFLDEVKTRAEQSDIGEFAPCLEGVESVLIALRGMGDTTPQPSAA